MCRTPDAPPPAPPSPALDGTLDGQLLHDLVKQHSSRLYHFIARHIGHCTEAEDLTQQTFVEAVKAYERFQGQSQLSTWLYGIALNLVRNHLSRAPSRRFEFVDETVLEDHASNTLTPDAAVEQAQTLRLLQEALAELPGPMRELLELVGAEEISYEEAAAMLSIPIGTVRSRLSRARQALRQKLQARGLGDPFA